MEAGLSAGWLLEVLRPPEGRLRNSARPGTQTKWRCSSLMPYPQRWARSGGSWAGATESGLTDEGRTAPPVGPPGTAVTMHGWRLTLAGEGCRSVCWWRCALEGPAPAPSTPQTANPQQATCNSI